MDDERGRYVQGHPMTGHWTDRPNDHLLHIRFIVFEDLKPLFEQLTEDGKDLIDEMRRDFSVRETEIWRLLHEDDKAAVMRYIERYKSCRWGWVLQRQHDNQYENRIEWANRISIYD